MGGPSAHGGENRGRVERGVAVLNLGLELEAVPAAESTPTLKFPSKPSSCANDVIFLAMKNS